MRNVIVSNLITIDGKFVGPNGEIDWHVVNDEFYEFAVEQLEAVDTLLFGRVTYEGMKAYWPTEQAAQNDPVVSRYMNDRAKIVFSKTLARADWQNTTVLKGDLIEEIQRLKQQPGKDMVIFGSGEIVSQLTQHGLIDEYRIFLMPMILGAGKLDFESVDHPVKLKLISAVPFTTGVMFLTYQPA